MNTRTVRLLIALFVVLMGIIAVLQVIRRNAVQQQSVPTATAASPYVFPVVETTTISRIELENRRTGRKLIFTKVPGDWLGQNEKGASVDVNLTYMPTLLQILATLRYNRIINGTQTLESFGLSNGGWFVVKFKAGADYVLRFGDNNPDGSQTYVQASIGQTDSPILQVASEAPSTLASIVDAYNLGLATSAAP